MPKTVMPKLTLIRRSALGLLVLALTLVSARAARAGDREMETLLVDMSPNGTPRAHACFMRIRRAYAHDYTLIHALGETATRRLAADADGDFMQWERSALVSVSRQRRVVRHDNMVRYDTVVLIDCRPDARTADITVLGSGNDVDHVRLRNVTLDRGRIRWLAARLIRLSWVGFSI